MKTTSVIRGMIFDTKNSLSYKMCGILVHIHYRLYSKACQEELESFPSKTVRQNPDSCQAFTETKC